MAPDPHGAQTRDGVTCLDVETAACLEYDPLLLDDHPLRTYPGECFPGFIPSLRSYYKTSRGSWGERVFCAICLLLVVVIILQTAAIIPYGISYLLPSHAWRATAPDRIQKTWLTTWFAEFQNSGEPPRCISYSSRAHLEAIELAAAAGCSGAKADIWLHDGEILVGQSSRDLYKGYTLRDVYLDPLAKRAVELTSGRRIDTLQDKSSEGFVLFLNVKTSLRTLWPHLVVLLDPLRDAGYLTSVNGSLVVPGFLTVVLTGRASSDNLGLGDGGYNDIFFDTSLNELLLEDAESPSELGTNAQSRVQALPKNQRIPLTYSATVNFKDSTGFPRSGRFSQEQRELIRDQVRAAHRRGLLARFEEIPCQNRKARDLVRRVLAQEGADLIEIDRHQIERRWWRQLLFENWIDE